MDSSEKNTKSNSKGALRRKGAWGLFSCFNGGLSLSDEDAKKRSNWGKRQIVVPVESSGEIESSTNGDAIGMKEKNQGTNRSHESSKDKSKTTTSNTKPQQTLPITREPSVCHVASKLNRTESAPLYKMLEPVHTRTRTSPRHHSSPEPGPRTRSTHDPSMGLCVLTAALAFIIFCGFTFAVIFMCIWFYIMYMLRNDDVSVPDSVNEKGSEKMDVNTEEYKKMVVLRGFLDRDRRKPLADRIRVAGF